MRDCSFFPLSPVQKGRIREEVLMCSKFLGCFFASLLERTAGNLVPLVHPFGDRFMGHSTSLLSRKLLPVADGRVKKGEERSPALQPKYTKAREQKNKLRAPRRATRAGAATRSHT